MTTTLIDQTAASAVNYPAGNHRRMVPSFAARYPAP